MVNNKKMRRNMIAEERDNMVFSDSTETELNADQEDYGNELEEMQIVSGNKDHLKKRVGELLYVYINLDTNNKKTIDLSYADIESKVMRSKLNEKKLITDYLKNMDDDERRVEDMKKMLKLGRWNVGLRKGLVNYDKDRYVEERNQLFEQLTNRGILKMKVLSFKWMQINYNKQKNRKQIMKVTKKHMILLVIWAMMKMVHIMKKIERMNLMKIKQRKFL